MFGRVSGGLRSSLAARPMGPGCERPRIGASVSTMSREEVTRQAPCFRRLLVPPARGSSGLPGTAKTSRPCSPASRAVISDPERSAASTTTTPSEIPDISRLRPGKVLAARREAERTLADEKTAFGDHLLQLRVLRRIDYVDAARHYGNHPMLERAAMRGGVDAAGEPRGDDETFEPEFARKLAREFLSRCRAVAGADDGDDGKGGELGASLDVEQGRGRIDMGERRRIARLAERDEICA